MIVYCTSQGFPYSQDVFTIQSEKWHTFKISLTKVQNNNYFIEWYIDNELVKNTANNIQHYY